MAEALTYTTEVNPRVTERFLAGMPGVLDARVTYSGTQLAALVTVCEEARTDPRDLQRACLLTIGIHQTPRRVVLQRAGNAAA
ncbi:MAG: hypothetical protein KIS66_09565 [Fimbriimonadaceae bacterium]|nr:hypothetical protein [Fimbriimonadaceae bacterium]